MNSDVTSLSAKIMEMLEAEYALPEDNKIKEQQKQRTIEQKEDEIMNTIGKMVKRRMV